MSAPDLELERHLQAVTGTLRGLLTALGLAFDDRPEVRDAAVDSLQALSQLGLRLRQRELQRQGRMR